jgi:hypothetical protein
VRRAVGASWAARDLGRGVGEKKLDLGRLGHQAESIGEFFLFFFLFFILFLFKAFSKRAFEHKVNKIKYNQHKNYYASA